MIDTNLVRYISRAVLKKIKDNIEDVKVYIEGEVRDTNKYTSYIEVRMDGPKFIKTSGEHWHLDITINVLIGAVLSDNLYLNEIIIGKVLVLMEQPITVLDDDGNVVACTRLHSSSRQKLEVNRFGLIDAATRFTQSSVEAQHEMEV